MSYASQAGRNGRMVLVGVIALMAGLLLLIRSFPTGRADLPPDLFDLRAKAHQAISQGEWCQARANFRQLYDSLKAQGEIESSLEADVTRQLKMLETLCTAEPSREEPELPEHPVPNGVEVVIPRSETSVERLPEEVFRDRYPVGKTIRSLSRFTLQGRGSNKAWGFRGVAHFNYLSVVPTTICVISNDPDNKRLEFEQTFGEVFQQCAVSNQTLELVSPDSLPMQMFWPPIDGVLKRELPGYQKFRDGMELINRADPGLKRVLSTTTNWLRRNGLELSPADPVEFHVVVEKLAGVKLRLTYESGAGISSITPLAGSPMDQAELRRLAHSCSLLADYFIFPVASRKAGEQWEIRSKDIGSLFSLYDPTAEFSGSIRLGRLADRPANAVAQLEVINGTVDVRSVIDGTVQKGQLIVQDGTAAFDLKDQYLRQADVRFSASKMHESRDHLLFGTEHLRDVKVQSHYTAELLESAE